MPANYAFQCFGAEALRRLPEKQQRPIQRFRRLYNGGVHGADLFFYFRPLVETAVGGLYHSCHEMSGRAFFTQACALLKQNPSEGATACLYGLLANYCLNTQLSPLLRQAMAEQQLSRTELEVELDRYLLCRDGKLPAHQQDVSAGFRLTRGECVTLSLFFSPATAANVYTAYRGLLFWSRKMAAKNRSMILVMLKAARGSFRQQLMPDHANHRCLHLDEAMAACLDRALECYPEMARQLTAHLEEGIGLGDLFEPSFH